MATDNQPLELNRDETIEKLHQLLSVSLWALANHYDVLFDGTSKHVNTTWISNTLEGYLGLSQGSLNSASFYDERGLWYLELVSLIYIAGKWVISNNLATTRI